MDNVLREHGCLESCCPGQFGAPTPHAGATFSAHTNLRLIDLRGDPRNPAFLTSAQTALGAALPLTPNTTSKGTRCEILWLGPDEWLLMSREAGALSANPAIDGGYLTDVSHGRAGWRLSGPRACDVLAKGCSVDLHVKSFAPGACAQTALAHVGVLLHRRDIDVFDTYCARSYAQHLWHWFIEAASEYGYEVMPTLR